MYIYIYNIYIYIQTYTVCTKHPNTSQSSYRITTNPLGKNCGKSALVRFYNHQLFWILRYPSCNAGVIGCRVDDGHVLAPSCSDSEL